MAPAGALAPARIDQKFPKLHGLRLAEIAAKAETIGACHWPARADFIRCLNLCGAARDLNDEEPTVLPMHTPSDEVLIGRIAGGDRLALQVLFARHHVRVYRFVLRLVREESAAQDLISDVFFEVWRQAGKFEGRSAVSTWMLSIARFKALSALRRRTEEPLDQEAADAIVDDADDPETVLAKKDEGAVLRECFDKLSAEQREIIDLVYYHEKSVAEVATIVGIPEATVKTRMFYARRKLSELLQERGIDRGWR
jgi:RNA polymerase sigma-70 factor, ECF subfamily